MGWDYYRELGTDQNLALQIRRTSGAEGGYAPANPPEWIAKLRPEVALEGYPLLRTGRNGWIELSTDGEKMLMEVERR